MNRVAIIDIGSNSLKLIMSDIYDNKFFQISYEKKVKLRLSNYKNRANDITALGIKKLNDALTDLKKICTLYRCNRIIAVATETLRKAGNGAQIIEELKDEWIKEYSKIQPNENKNLLDGIGFKKTIELEKKYKKLIREVIEEYNGKIKKYKKEW